MNSRIGAIEAGGTKFVCGIFDADELALGPPRLISSAKIPTTTPAETLDRAAAFFDGASETEPIRALGIGCFGPVDLREDSPMWGYITSTPKPGWRNTNIAGFFRSRLGVSVAFDTDVDAAAFGEYLWGAAKGLRDFVYLTVGTGIGGGVFSGGSLVHGMLHPEMGHIKVARVEGDSFGGSCPYHRDCLEGMASGPAIAARWGAKAETLDASHEAWELEARYLARAFAAYALVLSPERIILGGGVGMRPGLAERSAVLLGEELGGYIEELTAPDRLLSYVARPALGGEAGLLGSAALALRR
ncbi:MAG: ROK family protein [Spirochaetaceae bacterium]|nr:ROK family protein [Spirochaetaceae bacterium]